MKLRNRPENGNSRILEFYKLKYILSKNEPKRKEEPKKRPKKDPESDSNELSGDTTDEIDSNESGW